MSRCLRCSMNTILSVLSHAVLAVLVILVVVCANNVQVVSSFSSNNPFFLSSTNYLNSLPTTPITDEVGEGDKGNVVDSGAPGAPGAPAAPAHILPSWNQNSNNLQEVARNTPDEHYAKEHPGAGWAGYKDPMHGGYLDNLSENTFEEGKVADYGDDIRWGAQVYLDNLGGGGD